MSQADHGFYSNVRRNQTRRADQLERIVKFTFDNVGRTFCAASIPVLRTDAFAGGNYEGIKTMHIADFLLSDEY